MGSTRLLASFITPCYGRRSLGVGSHLPFEHLGVLPTGAHHWDAVELAGGLEPRPEPPTVRLLLPA